jgi:RecB family exonuclease
MRAPERHTKVVFGRLQARELRLDAARQRQHGLQVLTIEQLACRLAGGFHQAIDDEALRRAIQSALPGTELGELNAIKLLPGMVDACVDSLRKVWTAQIDLHASDAHPRLVAMEALEASVLAGLPTGMTRPGELVESALVRINFAPKVLGPIDVVGMTELEPCWRPLLAELAKVTRVRWVAEARSVPAWLIDSAVEVITSSKCDPHVRVASASTALHEAIEALRWARYLIAGAGVSPSDIAIASVSPGEFDDHFLALRADANLELHFAHGTKITASRDGQTVAALADILLRGISQRKFRRLVALLSGSSGPLSELPEKWLQVLPKDAPLSSAQSWQRLLAGLSASDWPDKADHTPELRAIVDLLVQGVQAAAPAGEALLRARPLSIWRKALAAGPAASLDLTLQSVREDDGLEACASVAWMPASFLAASPRKYVRLLGLNSSRWPRRISEDRLLSDHIVPRVKLDPLPASEADRRDFQTVLATTQREVVLSYSRRDSDGRLLGRSGLLQGTPEPFYLRRHRVAEHAFSETDRLASRAPEYCEQPQAISATRCWRNWLRPDLTPSDGLMRQDHPAAIAVLQRVQSASSLSLLLRNPLGFTWKYALSLKAPRAGDEPLALEPLVFGNLVHEVLDVALQELEASARRGAPADMPTVVRASIQQVSASWESLQPIPPQVLWRRTLQEVEQLAMYALQATQTNDATWRSFSEIPFGGAELKTEAPLPWDAAAPVEIPATGFRINGYIDRLDISADAKLARVYDYKTGKAPKDDIVFNKGQELQRCLYAFAVRALLGENTGISAALLYLRTQQALPLDDTQAALVQLQQFLVAARNNLASGAAVPGVAAGGDRDDLAFALPANAASSYCERKMPAIVQRLGAATDAWEAQ